MPYLPIDPNEKVTATAQGQTSQPVAQTGVTTGGVGGGAGPQGGAPKAGGSFTNLTQYLQANAGNTANADAAKSAVFDPLANQLKGDNAMSANATQHRADLNAAVDNVRTTGGVQAALEKAYGNTYANQGNKAFDAAISGRGVLDAAQHVSGNARPIGPAPKVSSTPSTPPPATSIVTPNPASASVASGKGPVMADPTAPAPTSTSTSKAMTWADPAATAPALPNSGRAPVFTSIGPLTPASGGIPHTPIYFANGGQVPAARPPYEDLMKKLGKC